MIEQETDYLCSGCGCPYSKCGPPLWLSQHKCCPDCQHTPNGHDEYLRFEQFVKACDEIGQWLGIGRTMHARPPKFPDEEPVVFAVLGTIKDFGAVK